MTREVERAPAVTWLARCESSSCRTSSGGHLEGDPAGQVIWQRVGS